jgi:hypothetical protein
LPNRSYVYSCRYPNMFSNIGGAATVCVIPAAFRPAGHARGGGTVDALVVLLICAGFPRLCPVDLARGGGIADITYRLEHLCRFWQRLVKSLRQFPLQHGRIKARHIVRMSISVVIQIYFQIWWCSHCVCDPRGVSPSGSCTWWRHRRCFGSAANLCRIPAALPSGSCTRRRHS